MFAAVAAWFHPAAEDKLKGNTSASTQSSCSSCLFCSQRSRAPLSRRHPRRQPPQSRRARSLPQCRQNPCPGPCRPPSAPAGASAPNDRSAVSCGSAAWFRSSLMATAVALECGESACSSLHSASAATIFSSYNLCDRFRNLYCLRHAQS
jgi:hypothetical protein